MRKRATSGPSWMHLKGSEKVCGSEGLRISSCGKEEDVFDAGAVCWGEAILATLGGRVMFGSFG